MIYDAHFHIIDPLFPVVPSNGYLPPAFTVHDYWNAVKALNVKGGVVVSGSFQAYDQGYLFHALEVLGSKFVGVANIAPDIPKTQLGRLDEAGVVAVRFNMKRYGSKVLDYMVPLSKRLFEDYGWHTELYVENKNLASLKDYLGELPDFSIDHLGLTAEGLNDLFHWVEQGIKVKASGFGRLDFDPLPVLQQIHSINPEALLFGTDLPSTRADVPFSQKDLELLKDHFSAADQKLIFYENAKAWYGDRNPKT